MFYLTANLQGMEEFMHFKKYCLPAFWHLPDFLYPAGYLCCTRCENGNTCHIWLEFRCPGAFLSDRERFRATGFCSIDQKVYYFDPDGYLFTPSQEGVMYLAQKPYYFLADGSVKTGLFSIKSASGISWYYAGANYQLFTNRTITLGGKIYCFGANGKSLPKGLQALNGKKYLISASGTAKTGRRKYKGKTYFFDSTGAMMIGKLLTKTKLILQKQMVRLPKKAG